LKAARRVNDYPTAVRIFEGTFLPCRDLSHTTRTSKSYNGQWTKKFCVSGIKAKVENKGQYEQYLEELKPLREELGVSLKEDLYPGEAK
jgi:cytochrome c oxidase subunit 5a